MEQELHQSQRPAKVGRLVQTFRNAGYPTQFLLAAGSGLVSVVLARYLRFHLVGSGAGQSLTGLAADLVLAMATCWAVKQMFRLEAAEFKAAQIVGVIATVACMHNLAYWMPRPMEAMFSKDWVEAQRDLAPQNSVNLFGVAFQFGGAQPEAPAKPKVVYRN